MNGIPFFFSFRRHLRDRPGEVRGVRSDHIGLKGGQIDFDNLIIIFFRGLVDFRIRYQEFPVGLRALSRLVATSQALIFE